MYNFYVKLFYYYKISYTIDHLRQEGRNITGTYREAFVPYSKEGKKTFGYLINAFKHRFTFVVLSSPLKKDATKILKIVYLFSINKI
jgi:hypothetical protein